MTTTTPNLADVAVPSGATRVDDWYDTQPGPYSPQRYFMGREWTDGDRIRVFVDGTQNADGRAERLINVVEDGYERFTDLTADRARAIGQASQPLGPAAKRKIKISLHVTG